MTYYADYEAIKVDLKDIPTDRVPIWLLKNKVESVILPICFCASDKNGEVAYVRDYYNSQFTTKKVKEKYISFLSFLDNINIYVKNMKIKIYFHNLKYDFSIILPELLYNDFIQYIGDNDKIEYELYNQTVQQYNKKNDNSGLKFFIFYGDKERKISGVDIHYKNRLYQLRDTYKILSASQDNILKDFGFDTKKEIDFDKVNINNLMDENNENNIFSIRERNIYDSCSLALSIQKFKDFVLNEFNAEGDTAASMAFNAIKSYLFSNEHIKVENELKIEFENEVVDEKKKWLNYFPSITRKTSLDGFNADTISRFTYNGGITIVNNNIIGKEIYDCYYYDINASYVSVMTGDLPYGEPYEIDAFYDNLYCEAIIFINFKIKNGLIPVVRTNSSIKIERDYNLKSDIHHTRNVFPPQFIGYIAINSIDMELIQTYYDIYDYEFVMGFGYLKAPYLNYFMNKIYDNRLKYKGVNKVIEQACKLIGNSSSGKPAQDLSGIVEIITTKDKQKIKILAKDTVKIYCPFSSCVIAGGRKKLAEIINKYPQNFLMSDTDSFVSTKPIDEKYISKTELGKWDLEHKINKIKILGKKLYMLENEKGQIIRRSAGLSLNPKLIYNFDKYCDDIIENELITFDNFNIGSRFITRKMVERTDIPGGLNFDYIDFTIGLNNKNMMY